MIEQLRHLLAMQRQANIEVRVVPLSAGWHPAIDGTFDLMTSDSPRQSVFVETHKTILWLHHRDDVNAYMRASEMIQRLAMSCVDSMRLIALLRERMERQRGDMAQV